VEEEEEERGLAVAGAGDRGDAGRQGDGEEGGERRRPTATAAVRGRKTRERKKEAGRLWAGPIKVCGVSSAPPRVEDMRTQIFRNIK
jgi:hypothetical protein